MEKRKREFVHWMLYLFVEEFIVLRLVYLLIFEECQENVVAVGIMIIVNAHGIIIFYLMPRIKDIVIKYVHATIQLFVLLGGISGYFILSADDDLYDVAYFTIFTLILYAIQFAGDIVAYSYLQHIDPNGNMKKVCPKQDDQIDCV